MDEMSPNLLYHSLKIKTTPVGDNMSTSSLDDHYPLPIPR